MSPAVAEFDRIWRIETGLSFLTGVELDEACLRPDSRAALSERMSTRALEVPLLLSSTRGLTGGLAYSVTNEDHGTEILPTAIVQVARDWLLAELDAERQVDGWQIADVSLGVMDFGVATLCISWEAARRGVGAGRVTRGTIDELNAEASTRANSVVASVTVAVQAAFAGDPLLVSPIARISTDDDQDPGTGTVLWVWNHCLAIAANGDHRGMARATADELCPNSYSVLSHRDHSYVAGVYTSITYSLPHRERDAVALSRAIFRQDGWWTLYWLLDRRLLDVQLEMNQALAESNSLSALEERASRLSGIAERLRLYQSRVDSSLVSSGAREMDAWNVLGEAWALGFRMQVVERKLEQLDRAFVAAVQHVARVKAARITLMIYIFTALGVLGSAVALAQFLQGGKAAPFFARIVVLGACAAFAFLAVVLSLRVRVDLKRSRA